MSKSPAFSFYPKDYESDENVKLMSLEQEGAYLRLLCHAWLHGSIPADVSSLAAICRTTPSRMGRLWPGIRGCWKDNAGRLVNGRQERERDKQRAYSEAQARKGRKGGRPKKPEVSPGFDSGKAGESLPSPSPFPSASTSTTPPNPLVTDRLSLEREAMALIREISTRDNLDPEEVLARGSEWKGGRKLNVAAMSEDRLLNTVVDLRRMRNGQPLAAPSQKALARVDKIRRLAMGGLDASQRHGVGGGHDRDGVHALGPGRDAGGDGLQGEALRPGGQAEPDGPPVALRRE